MGVGAGAGPLESGDPRKLKFLRPASVPYPADNPLSSPKERLGRALFFDPRLSSSGWIACSTCHNPGLAWGDGLPTGIGHGMKKLGRRTPTILNLAWSDRLFWDGRAESLEQQSLGPIAAAGEMNQDLPSMLKRLREISGYQQMFEEAFPGQGVTEKTVAQAIATFERGIVSASAPFDAWIAGDEKALSAQAKAGFDLFAGKAGCARCHGDWRFTDDGFHDIGVADADPGRGKFIPLEIQQHAFKTPGLRNIDRRGPYMHNGSVATLEQVVEFYDRGGDARRPSVSPEVRPLHLSAAEKAALVEFLKSLTSHDPEVSFPQLPR